MQQLFSVHHIFSETLREQKGKTFRELEDKAYLVEYITLPEAGQHVILRFGHRGKPSSLDEIDAIENMLDRLVGENFWAVIVGEAYRKVDPEFPLDKLPAKLEIFSKIVANIPLPVASTPFASKIKEDAQIIRSNIRLSSDDWIWEVEIPLNKEKTLPVIRIVSAKPRDKEVVTIGAQEFTVEFLPPGDSYKALVKAYPLARKSGQALLRFIFDTVQLGNNVF